MPETENYHDDGALEPSPAKWMRPEDAVAKMMETYSGVARPPLEEIVRVVDFRFEEPEDIPERADRVMIFLRSMMGDFRFKFPGAFPDMADAAVKAHFLAALWRTKRVSSAVRDAVLKIIDKRCR